MLTVQRISSRTVFSVVVREFWRRMQEVIIETSGTMWARWSNRSKVNVVFCCNYKGGTMQLKTTMTASLHNNIANMYMYQYITQVGWFEVNY